MPCTTEEKISTKVSTNISTKNRNSHKIQISKIEFTFDELIRETKLQKKREKESRSGDVEEEK